MKGFDQWQIKPKPQVRALKGSGKSIHYYPMKRHKFLGVADFDGWDLVENVISLVFARFFTLFFSFSLFICLNGASVHTLPWVQEVVSRVRLGASFCRPQAEDTSGEAFRAGHLFPKIVTVLMCEYPGCQRLFMRGFRFRSVLKPRMKSLWHPGYSHIRTVTILGVIRMGVYTTPDRFGAGTETIPDMASVNT